MLAIAYYFLQVVVCSGLMTGYYWLVLRNKRFHQYNRFYLLAITLLAWIVPLVRIRLNHQSVQEDPQVWQLLMLLANNNARIDEGLVQGQSIWESSVIPLFIYLLVAATLFIFMIRALVRLYLLLKRHPCRNVGDVYLILTRAKGTPFSFFRYIFWNEEIDIRSDAGKHILQHELTHVQQIHSIDKIFIQLVLVAGWFNPFFWIIRKEMDMIHEFIADRKSVDNGDTATLAQMLLTAAYPEQCFAMTNPFFSPVKRRLQMLTNTHSPRFSYIRRLVVLPLLAVVTVLFAFRHKEQRENASISVASVMENVVQQLEPKHDTDPAPSSIVLKETLPRDTSGVTKSVLKSINPIKVAFVDGRRVEFSQIAGMNPADINSIAIFKGVQAEALGAEPGEPVIKVETKKYVTIKPVTELVIRDTARLLIEGIEARTLPGIIKIDSAGENPPLILIDGVKGSFAGIKPGDIARVDVIKDKHAIEKYGSEAKNGVVEITTRKATQTATATLSNLTPATATLNNLTPATATLSNLTPVTTGRVSISATAIPRDSGVLEKNKLIQPSFPGGPLAWSKYLERTLNSGLVEKNGGPPGRYTVIVAMDIAADGSLSNVRSLNDPGYGTAAEALRVISRGPRWVPATYNGSPVKYSHNVAIAFNVPESK